MSKLTPDQQRIAIAKTCGWTDIRRQNLYRGDRDLWGTKRIGGEKHRLRLPDYPNDLNAMHNAIITKFVTIELQQKFAMQLRNLIKKAQPFTSRSWSDWDLITASLPQLSEAFLCTLGMWEMD